MLNRLNNVQKFKSPAKTVLARGIQIKIKDIDRDKNLRVLRETSFENNVSGGKKLVVPSFG